MPVPATNQPALRKYSGIVVHFGPASQSTVGWEEKEEKGEKESKTEEEPPSPLLPSARRLLWTVSHRGVMLRGSKEWQRACHARGPKCAVWTTGRLP